MARKLNKILRILTVTAFCAIASIFLFTGCTNKSAKLESPDASEYGLYTNLTLTIDSGDGKVWATVKNTFTFMPSTVRVSVELYKSATYKEDYTSMELASENTIADLNIGKTLLTEASTNGEKAYWQARMFYKIDEKEWQEQTTNVWLIDGNGNMVTTVITPPVEENIGVFTLKDLISSEPYRAEFRYTFYVESDYDYSYTKDGEPIRFIAPLPGEICFENDNKKLEVCYGLFNNVELQYTEEYVFIGDEVSGFLQYCFAVYFENETRLIFSIKNNGQFYCYYAENCLSFYNGGSNNKAFVSEEGAIDINLIDKFIEELNIEGEIFK